MTNITLKRLSANTLAVTGMLILNMFLSFLTPANALAGVVIIGHSDLDKLDSQTTERIFTGKVIAVNNVYVNPVNVRPSPLRDQFLKDFLHSDEEKYTAYWTVRRYIGKGTPPPEVQDSKAVVEFVRTTPGAIGYIDETEVTADMNVISR